MSESLEEGDKGNFIYKQGILDYNILVWNLEEAFGVKKGRGIDGRGYVK